MADESGIEAFSNPLAPPSSNDSRTSAGRSHQDDAGHDKLEHRQPLKNEDFRKLLMTPRVGATPVGLGAAVPSTPSVSGGLSVRGMRPKAVLQQESVDNKKKKKKFFAPTKKEEEDVLAQLAKKYRDRAAERREGANPDYNDVDLVAAYRAVAPADDANDAAERRRRLIEESKFLGGDMEHTHLVKGLDYALLQKVKAELATQDEDEEEDEYADLPSAPPRQRHSSEGSEPEVSDKIRTRIARNIVDYLFTKQDLQRNELFLPGRMAFVFDLENEHPENGDVPTTLLRSKAECPALSTLSTVSTNDIVINKLTQILGHLRTGAKKSKSQNPSSSKSSSHNLPSNSRASSNQKPPLEDKKPIIKPAGDSIYDDVDDYVPELSRRREKEREREKSASSRRDYFERSAAKEEELRKDLEGKELRKEQEGLLKTVKGLAVMSGTQESDMEPGGSRASRDKLKSRIEEPDSYAECYPGAPENDDAILDSDEEVDFSKMDAGTGKKGSVKRWDFDTQEEYGDYMSSKEALPKAAFQYGLKMADGRKTRRKAEKDMKAKLDRDWQKISSLISKRKNEAEESGSRKPTFHVPSTPDVKKPKLGT